MTKKDTIYIYDNVGDFMEWLRKTPRTKKGKELSKSTREGESATQFTGTESFDAAQELFDKGDTTLSRMIMEQSIDIKAKSAMAHMRSNGIVSGPQGFVPNIGAYMTGHPNNMVNIRQTFKPMSKVLTVVYDIAAGWRTKTNEMVSAATKVACAITTLEAKGYRINAYVSLGELNTSTRSKKCSTGFIIKIKDAGKPLDPLRIAYPLANPSMFRRHGFAFLERADWVLPHCYGHPTDIPQADRDAILGHHVYLTAKKIIRSGNNFEAIAKQIEEQSNTRP